MEADTSILNAITQNKPRSKREIYFSRWIEKGIDRMRPKKTIDSHIKLEMDDKTTSLLKVTNGLPFKTICSIIMDANSTASKARKVVKVDELIL